MQNRDNTVITQMKYIDDILCNFKVQDSKAVTTLLDNYVKLTKICVLKLSKKKF